MKTIWIDVENSPHVLFFLPIIRELQRRGHDLEITAREFAQTLELLERSGIAYTTVGELYGKNKLKKARGTLLRGWHLARHFRRKGIRPVISISHGSRGHVLGSFLLGVPAIMTGDYEYSNYTLFNWFAARIYVPAVLTDADVRAGKIAAKKVRRYPGLKEEVYLRGFRPDPTVLDELGVDVSRTVLTLRPPSVSSHYHNERAEQLLNALLERLVGRPEIELVVLPRYPDQKRELQGYFAAKNRRVHIPERAIDGPNLVWHSDAVISGGGTMIREAAALGVPAYSIFQGKKGAVDRYLSRIGRLTFVDSVSDVMQIPLVKKAGADPLYDRAQNVNLVDFFVNELEGFIS